MRLYLIGSFFKSIMIKSSILGSRKLGLVSTAILGILTSQPFSALALSEERVIDKLENVPTFTIVNREGKIVPLQLSPKGTQSRKANNRPLPLVFINPQDAFGLLQSLTQKKPELKNDLRVAPVQLSLVYQILQQAQDKKAQQPPLQIFPMLSEVRSALPLMTINGKKVEKPEDVGVPLFYAVVGDKEEYMIRRDVNNNEYIPFYWQKKEVEKDIELYRKQVPQARAQKITIKALPLAQFIQVLRENNNRAVEIMQIVPSANQIDTAIKKTVDQMRGITVEGELGPTNSASKAS